jgi:hypothetical protein
MLFRTLWFLLGSNGCPWSRFWSSCAAAWSCRLRGKLLNWEERRLSASVLSGMRRLETWVILVVYISEGFFGIFNLEARHVLAVSRVVSFLRWKYFLLSVFVARSEILTRSTCRSFFARDCLFRWSFVGCFLAEDWGHSWFCVHLI